MRGLLLLRPAERLGDRRAGCPTIPPLASIIGRRTAIPSLLLDLRSNLERGPLFVPRRRRSPCLDWKKPQVSRAVVDPAFPSQSIQAEQRARPIEEPGEAWTGKSSEAHGADCRVLARKGFG